MSSATIKTKDFEIELPVIEGSENEMAIDVSSLRSSTGYITLDPGYGNTGSCTSSITFIDGEKGILRYRGYPIEDLVKDGVSFTDVAYLLIYGDLDESKKKTEFKEYIRTHANIHEDMNRFFNGFPLSAHPMAILSSMVTALSGFHPDGDSHDIDVIDENIAKLIAKVKTIAAYSYRKSQGMPFIYPDHSLNYVENFLYMMFGEPQKDYIQNDVVSDALNTLLVLHADHEQNCSTSTVRMAGSSHANLFATISSGIGALWGPKHGGANQAVIEMLQAIHDDGGDYKKYINLAKDKESGFRLMGFGHRVYKNYDPRAAVIKDKASQVLDSLNIDDPLLEIAKNLEEIALNNQWINKHDVAIQALKYSNTEYGAYLQKLSS